PRAAVHHQFLGSLRHLGVEVVHQHPERRLLNPAFARASGAPRRPNDSGAGHGSRTGEVRNAECGVRNVKGTVTTRSTFPINSAFRIPHSAFIALPDRTSPPESQPPRPRCPP